MRALRETWAEAGKLGAELGPMPPSLSPETRGQCLAIVRDGMSRRRAVETCLRLPAAQGLILLSVKDSARAWPRLVAAAWCQYTLSRRARPRAGCHRIVDGVCRGAYRFFVLGADGTSYQRDTIWGTRGPFLELARLGIYERRQPPDGSSPFMGIPRCARCRRTLDACPCPGPREVIRFAVAQTRYTRGMCGRSLLSLADAGSAEALRTIAEHAPWLVDAADEQRTADELEAEGEPARPSPELELAPSSHEDGRPSRELEPARPPD